MTRNMVENPYSPDEKRVAKFFWEAGTGGGDDPIGSIIASHQYLAAERNRYKAVLEEYAKSEIHGAKAREALDHS